MITLIQLFSTFFSLLGLMHTQLTPLRPQACALEQHGGNTQDAGGVLGAGGVCELFLFSNFAVFSNFSSGYMLYACNVDIRNKCCYQDTIVMNTGKN